MDNQNFSREERKKFVELVKLYSDWLYSPVDEDLENKLYFMGLDEHNTLDEYYNDQLEKNYKKDKFYGIRIFKI